MEPLVDMLDPTPDEGTPQLPVVPVTPGDRVLLHDEWLASAVDGSPEGTWFDAEVLESGWIQAARPGEADHPNLPGKRHPTGTMLLVKVSRLTDLHDGDDPDWRDTSWTPPVLVPETSVRRLWGTDTFGTDGDAFVARMREEFRDARTARQAAERDAYRFLGGMGDAVPDWARPGGHGEGWLDVVALAALVRDIAGKDPTP